MVKAKNRLIPTTAPKTDPGFRLTPGAQGLSYPNDENHYSNAIGLPNGIELVWSTFFRSLHFLEVPVLWGFCVF